MNQKCLQEKQLVWGSEEYNTQLLYFTSSSLSADDKRIYMICDSQGSPNVIVKDLETGEIRLDIYRRMGRNCIEVYNTCTLPETVDPDRLFDRFYRVDESRSDNTGGTGIGLSMAQAIAEAHGGRIEAKRSGGNAIRFKVIL